MLEVLLESMGLSFQRDDFLVAEGLHQVSVLSPFLFIIVLEALPRKIRSRCPEELRYPDNLALVSETLEGIKGKLGAWKVGFKSKGLKI